MSSPLSQPKLAVILHADVVGSTELVQRDERAAHDRIQGAFRGLADVVTEHGGVLHELRGDAALAEFSRSSDAVAAALAFQSANRQRNATFGDGISPSVRVGISMGEVIVDDGTMTGAAVVLAQRLEQLAEPDGVCVHGSVYETVPRRLPFLFTDLGEQALKGFDEPARAYAVSESGGATVAHPGSAKSKGALEQEIRFCTTPGGVGLAYATVGEGPPLVKTGNWMSHLEYDWQSPIWRHLYDHLADHHLLVRYDPRGNGLSDWDIDHFSLEGWVEDLETVVDASGVDRFALLGVSQGCPVSVAYAARHPQRVTHLVLYGGYAKGAGQSPASEDGQKWRALGALIQYGWGQDNPAFRQMFTSMFMPGATREEMEWFNEAQRMSTSPHNARRLLAAFGNHDVTELLPRVETPTLVLHCRGDAVIPFEAGRQLARIPGARFVPLEGNNHLLVEHEPAWGRFVREVSAFLDRAAR